MKRNPLPTRFLNLLTLSLPTLSLLALLLLTVPLQAQTVATAPLTEQWRQGGEDSELFFGNVLQVLPADDGGLYVLDTQLVKIFHLDASGALVAELGGPGEGPGEVSNVNSMVRLGDGRLGLGQVLPGAVACLLPDGTPSDKFRIRDREDSGSAFVLFMNGWALGDDLLAIAMQWRMGREGHMTQEMALRSYDLQGNPLVDFTGKSTDFELARFVFTEQGFDFVWNRCAVSPEGNVVFAPQRDEYALQVCAPDGTVLRTITGRTRLHGRTGEQREEARRSHAAIASQYGRPVAGVEVLDTDPAVTGVAALADGRLWVRTGQGDRQRPAGVLTTVDEFDAEGSFVRQVQLKAPGDPARDVIHILPDGRVVVVTGAVQAYRRETNTEAEGGVDDDTVLEVVCYKLAG